MLVISLAFLMFIIWDQYYIKRAIPVTVPQDVKNYDIYLITTDNQDEFWQYINQGAADMAMLTGVKYYWKFPYERNPQKQVEVIRSAIRDGADALLISADDVKKISGVIEDAKARGIEVIYVDAPANEEAITTLATDNYEAGYTAGERMIRGLKAKGIEKGSIGVISFKDKVTETEREMGFREAVSKDSKYTLLPTVFTDGKPFSSQQATEQLIKQNPELVGMFGTNEGISVGMGNANKENNNKIISIAFDKSTDTMKLFDQGSLDIIIEQNPYTMGYVGMAEAIAALRGRSTGPKYFNTGFQVIDKIHKD